MAIVNQIKDLVNDSVKDALGKNATLTALDTSDLVSLGKALSDYDAFDKFYGALANRIVKTVFFSRTYTAKLRGVLRDENEYGAFVQKVYTTLDSAVDNPTHDVAYESSGAIAYRQHSPYDVENVIKVSAVIFGGQGTWSHEFIYSLEEIKTAFLSESAMMQLVDAIYTAADNSMKLDMERLEADAVNTSMANCIKNSKARNLLNEYNLAHPTNYLTLAQAMEDADFLKFATKEIRDTIKAMQNMSVVYNVKGHNTYTPEENLVVEVLSKFASATATHLESDTYHNELVSLPKYNEVSFWQNSSNAINAPFATVSAIKVEHADIDDDPISQTGIVCFVRDTENVAAYFGSKRSWEVQNPRDAVYVHGEQAKKGYAVDDHANAIVFYLEYIAPTENKKNAKAEESK